jgi:hypothetical protein
MVYEYPDEVMLAHAAAHRSALDKLKKIGELLNTRLMDPHLRDEMQAVLDQ